MGPTSWLVERLRGFGEADAIVEGDCTTSYRALVARVVEAREALGKTLAPGAVVALDDDYGLDSVARLIALWELQAIVAPGHEPSPATEAEWLVRRGEPTRVGPDATHPYYQRLRAAGRPGLVLYSSGSSGRPKTVLHDGALWLEKFTRPRRALRTIAFLLFDHVGGLNTLFHTLCSGGALITVADRAPDTVAAAVARHRAELLPTSPSFLNMLVLAESAQRHDLSALGLVTYGTERMPPSTLERARRALPHAELRQTYGMSELGILGAKSKDSSSTWVRVGGDGFETRVVDGILWVRARGAMLGYLDAPSPFDAEGWMCTGDRVEVDGDYLRILGRDSELINFGGQKVHPAEVEDALLELEHVTVAVAWGQEHPITGQIVVARVTLDRPEDGVDFRRRMRAALATRLADYKVPVKVEIVLEPQMTSRMKRAPGART